MKNMFLYFAMFLLILCVPFRGNEKGVRWLWAETTSIPATLVFISSLFIGFYLYEQRRKGKISEDNR